MQSSDELLFVSQGTLISEKLLARTSWTHKRRARFCQEADGLSTEVTDVHGRVFRARVRTDAQKTIHGPLITRPRPRGITGKYGNLPKVALPDGHNNAVSRAKSRPPKRSPRRLSSGWLSAASSQSSLQRCFWRAILKGRTPKFIPFFATLGAPPYYLKSTATRVRVRYAPCYYSREGYIENLRRGRYASHS